jgi:hypothetical protein
MDERPLPLDRRWAEFDSVFTEAKETFPPDFFLSLVAENASAEAQLTYIMHEPFARRQGLAVAVAWKMPQVSIWADGGLWKAHEEAFKKISTDVERLAADDPLGALLLLVQQLSCALRGRIEPVGAAETLAKPWWRLSSIQLAHLRHFGDVSIVPLSSGASMLMTETVSARAFRGPGAAPAEPAVHVSHAEAAAYANRRGFRLPSLREIQLFWAVTCSTSRLWHWTSTPHAKGWFVCGGAFRGKPESIPSPDNVSWEDGPAPDVAFRCVRVVPNGLWEHR